MKIHLLNAEQIFEINQAVCAQEKQTSHCRNHHALESAIDAATTIRCQVRDNYELKH
jgi:hypothetical protein